MEHQPNFMTKTDGETSHSPPGSGGKGVPIEPLDRQRSVVSLGQQRFPREDQAENKSDEPCPHHGNVAPTLIRWTFPKYVPMEPKL